MVLASIMSFITGLVLGMVFSFLNLPIPAPSKIEGVIAIFGIFLGYLIAKMIK